MIFLLCYVLYIYIYDMSSCDSYTSINVEYDEVLCELHVLQLKHNPIYVIFGGDLNTDLSRYMSKHTKSLIQYCIDDDIICSGSVTSFLDHLIFSRELFKYVVKFLIIDDMENSYDHLPVLLGVNFTIHEVNCKTTSHFIPTPQWFKATQEQLNHYRELLDVYLKSIIIPYQLVVCTDVHCTRHMSEIEHLYCSIVNVMLIAGRNAIPHSKPHRTKIEPLKEMTLFSHNEYCEIVVSILKCASILVKYIILNVEDTIKQHMYRK